MKPLTRQQAERWRKTREMGRRRYTMVYGMLLWGISSGLLWAIAMSWMVGWDRLPLYLLGALIGFPIGGVLWGRLMWRILEARYAVTPDVNRKRSHK
jgi:hypothetical protein